MHSKDDIINYIINKKYFSTKELEKIQENDISYLATKVSAKKIKINYNEIHLINQLSDIEINKFISNTNPYISSDKHTEKYIKKANFMFELRKELIKYYEKIKKPFYYLVLNDKSFVCPNDIPKWFIEKYLDPDIDASVNTKPLVCWNLEKAQMVYDFITKPFEVMGLMHHYCIKAFNTENEILDN